jgi:hypothetical protein
MKFEKAQRKKAKLRLALTGPSGSGKSYGALLIAKGIGGKIALIDTEKASASLYSHLVDFDTMELAPPYSPERFREAISAAESAGYEILIIDSITHEWSGVGGCLELVDEIARARYKGNSWSAWNDLTPRHRAFVDAILQSNMHIIATMRSKTETAQTEENGRKKVVKLGMKSEQREGSEYEFTTVLDIVHDGHYAVASKDRTGLFTGVDPQKISEETGKTLLAWLNAGVDAPVKPTNTVAAQGDVSVWTDELKNEASQCAAEGIAFYQAWWKGKSEEFRLAAVNTTEHAEFKGIASKVQNDIAG